ncbi:MAG TPA: helix-turn-helix transcriptional regulator [Candidatus Limnocylindria bacterium]
MLEARPPSVSGPPTEAAGEAERADELATEVARSVRELRATAGLSERAAARILGTSQTQLRRMEDPRYLPSLRSLARVAAAYGHRLKVSFEPRNAPPGTRERQPSKAVKPTPRPKTAPRGKRPASRPTRTRGRKRA